MARVSVVIPTYNYARYLGEAISSVLAQGWQDLELVVVDDGSTDDTSAVVAGFTDPRVRYVRQENRGPSAARNRGIQATSGELIAFLDGDDTWLPGKLERQVGVFDADPTIGLVYGGYEVFVDGESAIGRRPAVALPDDPLRCLAIENLVGGPPQVMVRRDALDRVGLFDETLRGGEDWELWFRVAHVARIGFVPEPVTRIRLHTASATFGERMMVENLSRVIRKIHSDPNLSPDLRALEPMAWGGLDLSMARFCIKNRNRRRAALYLARAIRSRPLWPDPWIWLFRVGRDTLLRRRAI